MGGLTSEVSYSVLLSQLSSHPHLGAISMVHCRWAFLCKTTVLPPSPPPPKKKIWHKFPTSEYQTFLLVLYVHVQRYYNVLPQAGIYRYSYNCSHVMFCVHSLTNTNKAFVDTHYQRDSAIDQRKRDRNGCVFIGNYIYSVPSYGNAKLKNDSKPHPSGQ